MTSSTSDVVVVGGGVIGMSTAFHLARRGLRVTVLERDHICAGTTGQSGGVVRQHYSHAFTARLAKESLEVFHHWGELIGGDPGFVPTGVLLVANTATEGGIRRNVEMHQGLGIETHLLDPVAMREVEPRLNVDDLTVAAWEPTAGYADPVATTVALTAAARDAGVEIIEGCAVIGFTLSGDRVTGVLTSAGAVSSAAVVNAAGVWGARLLEQVGQTLPIEVTRHPMAAVRRHESSRQLHPPILDVAIDTYLLPRGDLTLVGTLGTHPDDTPVDMDCYELGVTNGEIERLLRRGSRRMPSVARGARWGGWAGIYDETPDAHPVIDAVPGVPGLFCALGMNGNCFKLAPRLGELLAARVVDGEPAASALEPFRLDRFAAGETHDRAFAMRVLA